MRTRSGSGKRQLGRVITIRVSDAMDEAIVRVAGDRTRGDWLRAAIAEKLELENKPTLRRSAGTQNTILAAREDVEAVRSAAMSMARAIGMLKVTAAQMRVSGERDLHQKVERALAQITGAAGEVQKIIKSGREGTDDLLG